MSKRDDMAKAKKPTMKMTEEQRELFGKIRSTLQQQFALEYIKNGYEEATDAYRKACKLLKKNQSKNPRTSASEMLNNPNTKAFLGSVRVEVAEEAQTTALWVLKRLRDIDDLDVLDIMKPDLTGFRSLDEWPKVWRTSSNGIDLSSIMNDEIETVVKKIKWPDKAKNLELIGRHVNVKAWEKESTETVVNNNIMPVPVCDSVDDWEAHAQKQQEEMLGEDK